MCDFLAYFHVNDNQGLYKSLGYIHDTFKRALPKDMSVFVGWEEDIQPGIRYAAKIESRYDDYDRIIQVFQGLVGSFDPYIRLAVLLSKGERGGYKLMDLFDQGDFVALDVNC